MPHSMGTCLILCFDYVAGSQLKAPQASIMNFIFALFVFGNVRHSRPPYHRYVVSCNVNENKNKTKNNKIDLIWDTPPSML